MFLDIRSQWITNFKVVIVQLNLQCKWVIGKERVRLELFSITVVSHFTIIQTVRIRNLVVCGAKFQIKHTQEHVQMINNPFTH